MKATSPTSAPRASAFVWLVAVVALTPALLLFASLGRIHFSPEAHMRAGLGGLLLGLVALVPLLRHIRKRIDRGLHLSIPRGGRLAMKHQASLMAGLLLLGYAWSLVALALATLPATPSVEREFTVTAVSECTRKCFGCRYRATLAPLPGSSLSVLCVDGLYSPPETPSRLRIAGRFGPLASYVQRVRLQTKRLSAYSASRRDGGECARGRGLDALALPRR